MLRIVRGNRFVAGVLGLGLGGLVVWGFIQAVIAQPAVAGSIVGSIVAAAGGVFAVVAEQSRAERERLKEAHRKRMEPVYEEFVERVQRQIAAGGEDVNGDLVEYFRDLKGKQLMLGADAGVINAFNEWGKAAARAEQEPTLAAWLYEDLVLAIRSDLGHDDSSLGRGDLLRLFVNDVDEFVAS